MGREAGVDWHGRRAAATNNAQWPANHQTAARVCSGIHKDNAKTKHHTNESKCCLCRLLARSHTVTGASTRCTLLSSTSTSSAFWQSTLTSCSLSGSQRLSCSIHLSSSLPPAIVARETLALALVQRAADRRAGQRAAPRALHALHLHALLPCAHAGELCTSRTLRVRRLLSSATAASQLRPLQRQKKEGRARAAGARAHTQRRRRSRLCCRCLCKQGAVPPARRITLRRPVRSDVVGITQDCYGGAASTRTAANRACTHTPTSSARAPTQRSGCSARATHTHSGTARAPMRQGCSPLEPELDTSAFASTLLTAAVRCCSLSECAELCVSDLGLFERLDTRCCVLCYGLAVLCSCGSEECMRRTACVGRI